VLQKMPAHARVGNSASFQDLLLKNTRSLSLKRSDFDIGEGLDFTHFETVFSGGVAFAVYNSRFFTDAFASLETVYHRVTVAHENRDRSRAPRRAVSL